MKIRVLPATGLSAEHLSAWSRLLKSDATLASPFFRPEFTQAVAAVRGGIEVAIWEQSGEPVGFLPFQRSGRQVGLPVASPKNDFQGAIARADVAWSPQEVVRAAGLRAFRFDHLVATQAAFAPFQFGFAESPYIDVSQGYEHYIKSRSKSFRKHIKRSERKASDFGEIRFEMNPADDGAFRKLVEWKIDQCRRTHIPCSFAREWSVKLIEHILAHPTEGFSGLLLSLYIGDRLAAVQFAIRSGNVLHEWISAYNREMAECSPGLILDNRFTQQANSLGIARLDLGKGPEPYKRWHASGFDQVAEGVVHARPLDGPLYRALYRTKQCLRSTPLRHPVRRVRRWMLSTSIALGFNE